MSFRKFFEFFSEPFYDVGPASPYRRATSEPNRTLDHRQEPPFINNVHQNMPQDRYRRIQSEIFMIAEHYSKHEGIIYDQENCDWLIIPKYPLPDKWQNRWCKLLIIFPDAYPITPPIGFYLNSMFMLKNGGRDSHLIGGGVYGASDLSAQGWHWYCVQMQTNSAGGWKADADYRKPDNLWTFLTMARESLTNDF